MSEESNEVMNKLWNSYFYPGTNTLINKFGIQDLVDEKQKEEEESFEKLVELYENPIKGSFDKNHIKKIHKFLFESMYDWAGEYRKVNMTKYNEVYEVFSHFTPVDQIDLELEYELKLMSQSFKHIYSLHDLAIHLAEYYIVLLDIHPFREGNGRTVREFLREYVEEKSKSLPFGPVELDWTRMDENNINEYIELAKVFRGDIENEFMNGLVIVDEIKKSK